MNTFDSIKDLANKAVNAVKDVAEDVQDKAIDLKMDFDEAGGAKGILNKVSVELSEFAGDLSEGVSKTANNAKDAAGSAIDLAQMKTSELKASFYEAGGAKGLFNKVSNTAKEAANDVAGIIKGSDKTPKA